MSKTIEIDIKVWYTFFRTERRTFMDNEKPIVLQKNADNIS